MLSLFIDTLFIRLFFSITFDPQKYYQTKEIEIDNNKYRRC